MINLLLTMQNGRKMHFLFQPHLLTQLDDSFVKVKYSETFEI